MKEKDLLKDDKFITLDRLVSFDCKDIIGAYLITSPRDVQAIKGYDKAIQALKKYASRSDEQWDSGVRFHHEAEKTLKELGET